MKKDVDEHIVKLPNGKYRLVSKKSGKNLGTYSSRAGAAKRERAVEYFKHQHEDAEPSKKIKSFKEFVGDLPDVHNSDQEADSEEE